ncbi:hypothetical protein SteCoe_19015 [Stentor coeruleus]|uniref:Uncharacterized protein n=1 Tax=Stentor coeruleus TaxID=5963 RepID=A0A1R2BV27_9CILI|nr:hypothetical protein SteCoe_19015 [Stentor coeruleus]
MKIILLIISSFIIQTSSFRTQNSQESMVSFEKHTNLSQISADEVTQSNSIQDPSNSLFTEDPNALLEVQKNAQQEASDIEELRVSYIDENGEIMLNSADIAKEITEWGDLLDALETEEIVVIGETKVDLSFAQEEFSVLESTLKILEESNNIIKISDGQLTYEQPIITDSESLTSQAFETLTEALSLYSEEIPIISTTDSAEEIIKADGTAPILVNPETLDVPFQDIKTDEPIVPTSPTEPIILEINVNFLLLTSYISDEQRTGKVWVMPLEDPSKTCLLLEGFQAPLATCIDTVHLYLYIVDYGANYEHGSIFQYAIDIDSTIEIAQDKYVEVYSGRPTDCKVDSYGNLYFLDSHYNSINLISFPDLFAGFKNKQLSIYKGGKSLVRVNKPSRFDFVDNEYIAFANSDVGSGTLNFAVSEVESMNQEDIILVREHNLKAWGVAYGDGKIFYSLETAEIWVFDMFTEQAEILSTGFFVAPRGICYADYRLYVADHGIGALYYIDMVSKMPVLVASIQAIESVYCLNVASFMALSFLVLIFISA